MRVFLVQNAFVNEFCFTIFAFFRLLRRLLRPFLRRNRYYAAHRIVYVASYQFPFEKIAAPVVIQKIAVAMHFGMRI